MVDERGKVQIPIWIVPCSCITVLGVSPDVQLLFPPFRLTAGRPWVHGFYSSFDTFTHGKNEALVIWTTQKEEKWRRPRGAFGLVHGISLPLWIARVHSSARSVVRTKMPADGSFFCAVHHWFFDRAHVLVSSSLSPPPPPSVSLPPPSPFFLRFFPGDRKEVLQMQFPLCTDGVG